MSNGSKIRSQVTTDKVTIDSLRALIALFLIIDRREELPKNWAFDNFNKSKPFWESNIVKTVQTDFKGQAVLENLKPGDYWLAGIAETRAGVAIWNYKVTVKAGDNKVLLDQNNALYSK